jgi:hypothetical protein
MVAIDMPKFICYAYMWGKMEHYGELDMEDVQLHRQISIYDI